MTALILAVGLLGNVTGVLLYVSPTPTFVRIWRRRSTEGFSGVPYAVAVLSTLQWTYFGLLRGPDARPLVFLTSFGFSLNLAFNSIYLKFASKPEQLRQMKLLGAAAGFYLSLVILTQALLSAKQRATVVGIACAATSMCFSASPLLIMRTVIRTGNVEFMPFYLPLFLFLSSSIWTAFAWLTEDILMAVPNIVNLSLAAVQLLIFAYYKLAAAAVAASRSEKQKESAAYMLISAAKLYFPTTHILPELPSNRHPDFPNIETLNDRTMEA